MLFRAGSRNEPRPLIRYSGISSKILRVNYSFLLNTGFKWIDLW